MSAPVTRVRIEGANVVLALGAEEFATEYLFKPGTAHEIGMQLMASAEAIMNALSTAETLPAPPEAPPTPARPCGSCYRGRRYDPADTLHDDEGFACPACKGTGFAPEAP